MDWLEEYRSFGVSAVADALYEPLEAEENGFIEAPEGARGLAAAEAVANAFYQPDEEFDAEILENLSAFQQQIMALPRVVSAAQRAVAAISDQAEVSELLSLWEEQDKGAAFLKVAAGLQARLGKAQ
ncbi:MAG: DUF4259 domain-containing protein [Marinovum sp.]|nr:DUF4259 domain-containing protein [Marinovum sp.]